MYPGLPRRLRRRYRNNGNPAPLNQGNPHTGFKTQNGFGTFGQPTLLPRW
jgi:hypothetical protein